MIDTALILAAGLGTRLAPLSSLRAKAALPVAGEALIRHQVRWLAAAGVRRVLVNLHHLPATVTRVLGHGDDLGVEVRYSWEPQVLGSAGGPRQAFDLVDDERLLVVNGDTITDLDLAGLVAAHAAHRPLVTMAVTPARPGYNALLVNGDGAFAGVRPASATGDVLPPGQRAVHFMGVQVIERAAVTPVPRGAPAETVKWLYPELCRTSPEAVRVWDSAASFFDVGTPAEYLRTAQTLAATWHRPLDRGARCDIHPGAIVAGSVLWDDVRVEAGATLQDCIVGDGVRVPAAARVTQATIVRLADRRPQPGDLALDGLVAVPFAPAAK